MMEDYEKRIKLQTALLWVLLILTLAANVVLGVMWDRWFLDPREMTELAQQVQKTAYFGFLIYLIVCIVRNKRLLRERGRMEEKEREEKDERRRFVSGLSERLSAQVFTVLLSLAVFVSSLLDMTAFAVLLATLGGYAALRLLAWLWYSRKY